MKRRANELGFRPGVGMRPSICQLEKTSRKSSRRDIRQTCSPLIPSRCERSRLRPKVVRQIYNDRFGRDADNDRLKRHFAGRIYLLAQEPRADKKKIPSLRCSVKFPALAPASVRIAAENAGDCALMSTVTTQVFYPAPSLASFQMSIDPS
jgi:hypothetical protein